MKSSLALLALVAAGCSTSNIHEATNGSLPQSSGGSSAGASSSGASGTSTGTSNAATSSGGATTGGTSGGTTGGPGANCPAGAAWIGDTCALTACSPQYTGAGCRLMDGGIGECLGEQCLNVSGDPLHCGSPETACALGMACDAGSCVGSSGCVADGGCPAGDVCQSGGRRCLPSACDGASGQRLCNGGLCCGDTCTDLDGGTDCGACGVSCGDGGFCYPDPLTGASKCGDCSTVPNGTACNAGICCGGTCVDQTTDGDNCGGCGHMCVVDAGGICSNGVCSGPCGGCGCDGCPAGSLCYESSSADYCLSSTCTPGHDGLACGLYGLGVCCGSTCIMGGLGGAAQNCGGCGKACPDGDLCSDGVCVQPLGCAHSPSETLCLLDGGMEGVCCDGQCVDTASTANCTECGNVCPTGSTCTNTGCSTFFCSQASCPPGTICTQGGQCMPGCDGGADGDYCAALDDTQMPYNGFCCGGVCATLGEPESCGGCGLVCPTGAGCFGGGCQLQASSSPLVCGAPGAPVCADGYGCVPTNSQYGDACAPRDCTGLSSGDACAYGPERAGECCSGVCVSLTQDPANCGACGLSCPSGICSENDMLEYVDGNPYPVLVGVGVCKPPVPTATCTPDCAAGFTCVEGSCVDGLCTGEDCIQQDDLVGACCGDGACVDLLTDSANCSGCGLACPQGEACASGQCQGDACSFSNSGAYCGANDATHACCGNACVDTSTDPANCGGCGVSCQVGATCSGGNCG